MKNKDIIDLIEDEELKELIIARRKIQKGKPKIRKDSGVRAEASTTIYAPADLLAKVRVIAATDGKAIRGVIHDAIKEHVETWEKANGIINLKTTNQ